MQMLTKYLYLIFLSELWYLVVFVYSGFKCVNSNTNCFVSASVVKSVYLTIKGKNQFAIDKVRYKWLC